MSSRCARRVVALARLGGAHSLTLLLKLDLTHSHPSRAPAASFRELGPPDLCHVIKTTGKAGTKDVSRTRPLSLGPSHIRSLSSPHTRTDWVISLRLGSRWSALAHPSRARAPPLIPRPLARPSIAASSSASLAAYLNSLQYTVEETASWFFGAASTKGAWRIRGGAFCSFNAFSRVDVRVEVKIPGGVEAYVIDLRGER